VILIFIAIFWLCIQLTGFIVCFSCRACTGQLFRNAMVLQTPFKTYMSLRLHCGSFYTDPLILITMAVRDTFMGDPAVIAGMTLVLSFLIGWNTAGVAFLYKNPQHCAKNYSADSLDGSGALRTCFLFLWSGWNTGLILAFMNTFSAFSFMRRKNFVSLWVNLKINTVRKREFLRLALLSRIAQPDQTYTQPCKKSYGYEWDMLPRQGGLEIQ